MRTRTILPVLALTTLVGCGSAAAGPFDTTAPSDPPRFAAPAEGPTTTVATGLRVTSIRRVSDELVEIRGSGFGASGVVTLDGMRLSYVSWSEDKVTIPVPSIAPGSYAIRVVTGSEETKAESNPVEWTAGKARFNCGPSYDTADESMQPAPLPTYVSVTFDGGFASHAGDAILGTLDRLGMRATFFVNSGLLGAGAEDPTQDRLDEAGLARIAQHGHEIGGSTMTGGDLLGLSADQAKSEICDGRAALVALGYHPTAFGLPAGDARPDLEAIAKGCGYDGARVGPNPSWNTYPSSSFALHAMPSFTCSDGLATMKSRIRTLEGTGGYLAVVFDDVCDENCSYTSTRTADVVAFLDWLDGRKARGTFVRTVGDMIANGVRH